MAVSGYLIFLERFEYKKGEDVYDYLRQFVDSPINSDPGSNNPRNSNPGDSNPGNSRPGGPGPEPENRPAPATAAPGNNPSHSADIPDIEEYQYEPHTYYLPGSQNGSGTSGDTNAPVVYSAPGAPNICPTVDFDGLWSINEEVAAWLRCPGTVIDYPVVRGTDNEYYLDHLVTGSSNSAGSLFIDCRNNAGFSDRNTIIYGHNMKNGSMFCAITQYRNQGYLNARPFMYLVTPLGEYIIEIFSAFTAGADEDAWRRNFRNDEEFESWIDWLREKSFVKSDLAVTAGDRVVTLSTCTYEFDNARFIVVGKLVSL